MRKLIVDAKRPLVFEITAEDVRDAKRHNKNHCVIAKAVGALPGVRSILVGVSTVHVTTESDVKRYATPPNLKKALTAFDATGQWSLPAGVYSLKPPGPWLAQDYMRAKANKRPDRHIDPKTGKDYGKGKLGTRKKRLINPRVLEFSKIRKVA